MIRIFEYNSYNFFKVFFFILLLTLTTTALSKDNNWRGLKISEERRCSPYNRSNDYNYSPSLENKIVESLGDKIYSPYSGKYFKSIKETDIEHIVSLSEAHDSGLCAANKKTKIRFASDIKNLTLASPGINQREKSGHDASGWIPEKNKCWFANKIVEVKKDYNLTVDSEELVALEKIISKCPSFQMVFFNTQDSSQDVSQKIAASVDAINESPVVKKSRSKYLPHEEIQSYYSKTKNYQPFPNIQSCLSAGGRCPKRDSKCKQASSEKKESFFSKNPSKPTNCQSNR